MKRSMSEWTQQERDEFYTQQAVYPGDANNTNDRCGWIKEMYKVWKPASILDVACRDGYVTRCFLPYSIVYGVDINDEAIKMAQAKASEIPNSTAHYFCQNILTEKLGTALLFELVMSFEFVEHIPADMALDVFKAMTKYSNKRVCVSTPNATGAFGYDNHEDDGHINLYEADRLFMDIAASTGCNPEIDITEDFLYAWWEVS